MDRLRPNDTQQARFVVNPRSAGGGTGRRLDALRRSIDRYFTRAEVCLTEAPGHAGVLAREGVEAGADLIVAVGGDGTASETANGLFEGTRALAPDAVFAVVPAGTGSDLVRTLGMPSEVDAAVRIAAFGPDRRCDVAHVQYVGHGGEPSSRIGLNVVGFGVNGRVVAVANASDKRLGGTLTFARATMSALWSYRASPVEVRWVGEDGAEAVWSAPLLAGFAANGAWCGGGMWVGRGGAMDDGLLDLLLVEDRGLASLAPHLPKLYTGKLDHTPGLTRVRARSFLATSPRPQAVPVDVDGEQPGHLPLSVSVLSKAVKIRGVWG